MTHLLVRVFGWSATVLHGDPSVFDRWRWLKRHLRAGPYRTLDAGCGSGALTLYAARKCHEAVGLSYDDANTRKAIARSRILKITNARFLVVDLRELDKWRERLGLFDQVLCLEAIEHILNDRKLVHDLAALLAREGRLLLTTPYKHGRDLYGDHVSPVEDGGHVRKGYTHEEIEAMFAEQGLAVMAAEFVSGIVSQKVMGLQRLLSTIHPVGAWMLTLPLRLLWPLDRPLTSIFRHPYLSIAVVARKI